MASATAPAAGVQRTEGPRTVAFRLILAHLVAFIGPFFVALTPQLLIAAAIGFVIRVFAIEGAMHRYFSHRAFKTSRAFQCVLAVLGASNSQRGPIWWAGHHRRHHRMSDQPGDYHSPVVNSRFKSYIGWLFNQDVLDTKLNEVEDLSRFPELVWINKHHYIFPLLTLAATYAAGEYTALFGSTGLGWAAVVWVFFVSTVASIQTPYIVNTFAHGSKPGFFNRRRFQTNDTSTNLWWLALPTLGGCFHNNHHRFMISARSGFYWYEVDLIYWMFRALAAVGLIWDLKEVPQVILEEGRRPVDRYGPPAQSARTGA